MLAIVLAPDILVNASVAPGTPPDQVVQRVLGKHKGESATSDWVLARVEAMLSALPDFKKDAVTSQLTLMRSLLGKEHALDGMASDAWAEALAATAKKADATRVVTDHPDLLEKETQDGIEFISSEAWLLEAAVPPPPPV